MGWANCGADSKGRPIGYAHAATCDGPGCAAVIDRGLSYACGGMHGEDPNGACEGYFCPKHLTAVRLDENGVETADKRVGFVEICGVCAAAARQRASCECLYSHWEGGSSLILHCGKHP